MVLAHFLGPTYRDFVYAKVDGKMLHLDLYLPAFARKSRPLVVYLHGGGWSSGSYKNAGVDWLTGYGFAVASVQYRLSGEAKFPAQIHDVKGAIRWLRANADRYGYDASWLGVVGISAGGHLAMLAGLVSNNSELEGTVGGNLATSSAVDAVVSYSGASDLVLRAKNQPNQTEPTGSVVHQLLGVAAGQNAALAEKASPAFHVSDLAPPLLVLHGAKDSQVNVEQAHRIAEEYERANREVALEVLSEGGHGGPDFFTRKLRDKVAEFLRQQSASKLG